MFLPTSKRTTQIKRITRRDREQKNQHNPGNSEQTKLLYVFRSHDFKWVHKELVPFFDFQASSCLHLLQRALKISGQDVKTVQIAEGPEAVVVVVEEEEEAGDVETEDEEEGVSGSEQEEDEEILEDRCDFEEEAAFAVELAGNEDGADATFLRFGNDACESDRKSEAADCRFMFQGFLHNSAKYQSPFHAKFCQKSYLSAELQEKNEQLSLGCG